MTMTTTDRALAKLAGAAQRAYQPCADIYRVTSQDETLPVEIRRDAVAVIEALDLLRFHIREATLGVVVRGPSTAKRAKGRKRS